MLFQPSRPIGITETGGRPSRSDRSSFALAIAVTLVATTSAHAVAASQHKHRQTNAPTTRDTDTSSTAAIPSKHPEKAVPDPTAKDDDVLPTPFRLPSASRQRMRDCGLKWQAMKSSGEAGEEIWRDFATRCLAASNGPLEKRSEQ